MTAHPPYSALALLIAGEEVPASARRTRPVVNPATRQEIGVVPLAEQADLDRALAAAGRAFPSWRDRAPHQRASVLHRAAALLRERLESLAHAMTLENGKTLAESRSEVAFTADIVDFLAAEGQRTYGTVIPSGAGGRTLLLTEPVGPVAAFTPWNYPLTVPARKIAAALAAGCSMVLKADEETPASALAMGRALVDAGLPDGVLSVVFGDPAQISESLIASPIIRKVSFTGSTPVGKHIAGLAAQGAKPLMLELGGHAPVLVFDDVDIDAVAEQAIGSKFHNGGQSCGSPTRFYIHESLHDRFVERFAELASRLRVGDGLDESSDMGPLANLRRLAAMQPLVDDALAHGAELVTGGTTVPGDGYLWAPTVLARVPEEARLMNEEPFGPIAMTATFRTREEAIAKANRLPFGLGAYVFSGSIATSSEVPRAVEAGMIGVNRFNLGGLGTFFGGVKESGYGSEGGPEAVQEYTVRKLISQA